MNKCFNPNNTVADTLAKFEIPIVEMKDLEAELTGKLRGEKSMLRNRPYDGQSHTDQGVRGAQEIFGITMRDLTDCYIRAVLLSSCHMVPHLYEEALKGELANLDGNDLFGFDLDALDPIAIAQNMSCEVEKIMGIYPNVPGMRPGDVK